MGKTGSCSGGQDLARLLMAGVVLPTSWLFGLRQPNPGSRDSVLKLLVKRT